MTTGRAGSWLDVGWPWGYRAVGLEGALDADVRAPAGDRVARPAGLAVPEVLRQADAADPALLAVKDAAGHGGLGEEAAGLAEVVGEADGAAGAGGGDGLLEGADLAAQGVDEVAPRPTLRRPLPQRRAAKSV